MAMSAGGARYMSRQEVMLKERALFTAKNPSESKFGTTLLKNNAQEHRILDAEMLKIERQLHRKQMHLKQEVKQFLRKHVLPDPMIIVQRPPSPEVLQKHGRTYGGEFSEADENPHYMRPLESKRKPISFKATIDAFRVKPKKKYNVWEEVTMEKQKPEFRSLVNPTWPLTEMEVEDLQKGLEYHQPYRPRTTATGTPIEGAAGDKLPALPSSKPSTRGRSVPQSTSLSLLPTPPSERDGKRTNRRRQVEEKAGDEFAFMTEVPSLDAHLPSFPFAEKHGKLDSTESHAQKPKSGNTIRKRTDKTNSEQTRNASSPNSKDKRHVVIHTPNEDQANVTTGSFEDTLVATSITTAPRDQHVSAHVVINHYQCAPGESHPNSSQGGADDFDPNRKPSGLAVILEALEENGGRH